MKEEPLISPTPSLPDLFHVVTQVKAANICPHHLSQGFGSCFCNLDNSDSLSN